MTIYAELGMLASLLLAGAVVGTTSGFFGIGGGVILVPTFYMVFRLFGVPEHMLMHMAVATSLATMIPACSRTVWRHYRLGNIDISLLKKWVPGLLIGAVIGLSVVQVISTQFLKTLFLGYLYISLLWLLSIKYFEFAWPWYKNRVIRVFLGLTVGALSVLIGIGGGTFVIPLFRHAGFVPKKAGAISAASGCIVASIGTIVNIASGIIMVDSPWFALGYVNLLALVAIVPVVWYIAPRAAMVAHSWPHDRMQHAYLIFLISLTAVLTWEHFVSHLY